MTTNKPIDLALTAEHMLELAAYLDGIGRSRLAGHARDALTALEAMRPVVEAAETLERAWAAYDAQKDPCLPEHDMLEARCRSAVIGFEGAVRTYRAAMDGAEA
ncbi:MAG: hypothetical protein WC326_02095 [Candidatus Delongbacteria bacterium]